MNAFVEDDGIVVVAAFQLKVLTEKEMGTKI